MTRTVRTLLVLCALAIHPLAQATPPAESWPSTKCSNGDYWLAFAEVEMCFERSDIRRLEHSNLPSPTVTMQLHDGEQTTDLTFSRLDDQMLTGGLHEHLGKSVSETFELLRQSNGGEKHDLAREVMDVDQNATVRVYGNGQSKAYALLRESGKYSSIFMLHKDREGGIKIGGEFDQHLAERLLSAMRP